MKHKTIFSLLCLTWMVLLSIPLLDLHAASESSACTDYGHSGVKSNPLGLGYKPAKCVKT